MEDQLPALRYLDGLICRNIKSLCPLFRCIGSMVSSYETCFLASIGNKNETRISKNLTLGFSLWKIVERLEDSLEYRTYLQLPSH